MQRPSLARGTTPSPSLRDGATIFPRLGREGRWGRMIVRSDPLGNESKIAAKWAVVARGRHIHSLLMPRNSHISGWRTPWRGLFLASFILSLSLSKPGRTTTSFLHKSRAFNARFERGRTSRRVWVRDGTRRILEMCTLPCYILGDETGGGYPACGEVEILLAGPRTKACGIESWINKRVTSVLAR